MSGSKPYQIKYSKDVLNKDIPNLSKSVKAIIKRAIEEKLAFDPIHSANHSAIALKDIEASEWVIIE